MPGLAEAIARFEQAPLAQIGVAEDLAELKAACRGKLALLGNM